MCPCETLSLPETYELTQTESGTELRYTMGQAFDETGNRSQISEQEIMSFLSEFWPQCFDKMEVQLETTC